MAPPPEAHGSEPFPFTAPTRRGNPWWIPSFFGRAPEFEPRVWQAMGLVALGLLFESYDLSLINSALKHIAEDLEIAIGDTGYYLGAIRLGGVAAFLILPFADRIGRRRIFLASLAAMSLGTMATAFSATPLQFVALQIASRACMLTTAAVGVVIAVEEMPAEHRGWGLGVLFALSGLGYGLGTALFAFIEVLPFGWRALYAIGAVPLLLLPRVRRRMRETERFEAHRHSLGSAPSPRGLRAWIDPIARLARTHPLRAAGIGCAGMFGALGSIAVFQYLAYFVQVVHGWKPWHYSVLVIAAGTLGIAGSVVGGALSDRIGRRWVGLIFLGLYPAAAILFYNGPTWSLAAAWAAIVFCNGAGEVVVRALATELFPTSHRGTATGWVTLLQTLGWTIGLGLMGLGTGEVGDLARTVSLLSLAVGAAGLCVFLLPETRQRELESLSSER